MNQRLALIIFLDGVGGPGIDNTLPTPPNVPGYPLPPRPPWGGPVDPGYGQGWEPRPHPGHGLPHPPHYPTTGPVFPPIGPDNTLPAGPPPTISLPIVLPSPGVPIGPDQRFELKYSPIYGWVLVPINDDEAEPK